jgi:hypothetical protein
MDDHAMIRPHQLDNSCFRERSGGQRSNLGFDSQYAGSGVLTKGVVPASYGGHWQHR